MDKEERVQKIISNYSIFSRRQVDRFIMEGRVVVNGEVAIPGTKANVNSIIEIDGKRIKLSLNHLYFILNKPKGYISSRVDRFNKQVISLIPPEKSNNRNLFTIGRLDVNTTGLIIITTDGNLSRLVEDPKFEIRKTYLVWVDGIVTNHDSRELIEGVELRNGYVTRKLRGFKIINQNEEYTMVKIVLTEGKKNQIKEMFLVIGLRVINLKRVKINSLELENLELGNYKKVSKEYIYDKLNIRS